MRAILAPSILAADHAHLHRQVKEAEQAGVQYLHVDMMDGVFVPGISFSLPLLQSLRRDTHLTLDVHMMVQDPIRFLPQVRKAGADVISINYEADDKPSKTLDNIRGLGAKAGIVLNPETPLSVLNDSLLMKADVVQLMSVAPGVPDQAFLPETVDKLESLARLRQSTGHEFAIEVDGGILPENVGLVLRAGAEIIVSGGGVFKGDIGENIHNFGASLQNRNGGAHEISHRDRRWHQRHQNRPDERGRRGGGQ